MIRVTIIPSDKLVIVGDVAVNFDFATNPNYHAIQWNGESGFIETVKGSNIKLDNLDEFTHLLDKHKEIVDAEQKKREDQEALQNTAEYKNAQAKAHRANAYRNESDPYFFKWQRGEMGYTEQGYLDLVGEIQQRYPYSVE